jgi:hypothetical protein
MILGVVAHCQIALMSIYRRRNAAITNGWLGGLLLKWFEVASRQDSVNSILVCGAVTWCWVFCLTVGVQKHFNL